MGPSCPAQGHPGVGTQISAGSPGTTSHIWLAEALSLLVTSEVPGGLGCAGMEVGLFLVNESERNA